MRGNISVSSFFDGDLVILRIELDLSDGILRFSSSLLRFISEHKLLLLLIVSSFICIFIFLRFTIWILTILTSGTLIELSELISVHSFPLLRTSLEVFLSGYVSLRFDLFVLTILHDIGRDGPILSLLYTDSGIFGRLPSHGISHAGAGWIIDIWSFPSAKLLMLQSLLVHCIRKIKLNYLVSRRLISGLKIILLLDRLHHPSGSNRPIIFLLLKVVVSYDGLPKRDRLIIIF